jgi:hypothetical protein
MFFHFALTLVEFSSASKSTFKLGVTIHVASYKLISFFNDENILSACPDFGFAVEIDIAFANSDFRSVSDFMSENSTATFTSYSPCISSVKAHFPLKSLSINDFANRVISFLLAKAKTSSFSNAYKQLIHNEGYWIFIPAFKQFIFIFFKHTAQSRIPFFQITKKKPKNSFAY